MHHAEARLAVEVPGRVQRVVRVQRHAAVPDLAREAHALLGKPGDRLTIMSFTEMTLDQARTWNPRVVVMGEDNAILNERGI